MRSSLLLVLAGCQQVLGLEPPRRAPDAAFDAPHDATIDGPGLDAGPCGLPDAAVPPATVMQQKNNGQTTVIASHINPNGGQLVTAPVGSMLQLQFDYQLTDTSCANNCIDQIEVGYAPGTRVGCVFDGPVPMTSNATGIATTALRVPLAAGAYDIRINIGQDLACSFNGATDWWGSPPAADTTIVRLCVTP